MVDETSMRKRHRYVTVIVNGDTGKTLAIIEHRNAAALSPDQLRHHFGHPHDDGAQVAPVTTLGSWSNQSGQA